MSEPRSLTADLRAAIEARKEIHPLEFRLVSQEKKTAALETAMRGVTWEAKTTLGNSRKAIDDVTALNVVIDSQREQIIALQAAVGELQAGLIAAQKRIEDMAQWAKNEGETMRTTNDLRHEASLCKNPKAAAIVSALAAWLDGRSIVDEDMQPHEFADLWTADRLEELTANMITIPDCIGVVAMMGDTASTHGARTIGIRRQTIQVME